MRRETVEDAITSLEDLLDEPDSIEADFQNWFEQHPIVFQALGFSRYIPQPVFRDIDGEEWRPDFLVQRSNGRWEIFELKLPGTALIRNARRRVKFYAAFEKYISQCHEYSEVLDQETTRREVEKRYELDLLNKRPRSILVAGRSVGVEYQKLYTLADRRNPPISVYTYDDIRDALVAFRTVSFSKYDEAEGFSLVALVNLQAIPNSSANRNHLLDIGYHRNRDRVSVFIDSKSFLNLKIWDSEGRTHEVRSRRQLRGSDYGRTMLLLFEAGVGSDFGFISIQVDGSYRADVRIQHFPFRMQSDSVIGSDWSGTAPSWFLMGTYLIIGTILNLKQKTNLRKTLLSKTPKKWMKFEGGQFLASKSHPLNLNE